MKPTRVTQGDNGDVWMHLTRDGQVTQTAVLNEQEAFELLNDLILLLGKSKPKSNVITLSDYR